MPVPEPLGEGGDGAAQYRLFTPGALIELVQQAQAQLFEFTVAARGVDFGAASAVGAAGVAGLMLVHPVHFAILTDQRA